MLIVPTEDIKAGMRLAAPLLHPDNPQHELLRRGYTLELAVLPRLRDLGVPFVYVDFPGLDDLDRHLAPRLSPERQDLYQQVKKAVGVAQGRTRPAVSYSDYYACTRSLITTLLTQGQHPLYLDAMAGGLGQDEVAHATGVAHLSLLLGLRMETYLIAERKRLSPRHAREVVNLGVAGMLHDMGKLKLPEPLRTFTGIEPPEDAAERSDWESHVRLGYDLIRGGVESSAASTVLHHHQHFDGTGFPAKPQDDGSPAAGQPDGKSIHVFSRILMAADLYERLALPRGARNKRSNLEVYHDLRTRYAGWVDPVVLKTLQAIAPPILPGTTVVLSDRTQGVVVDVKPDEPYAPIVKRLRGDGMGLVDPEIDLSQPGAPTLETAGGVAVRLLLPENVATRAA